jgi:hypothetical protein
MSKPVVRRCGCLVRPLRCDAPGCSAEIALRIGGEQYCWPHAEQRANTGRKLAGLPPVTFDDAGLPHTQH